MKLGPRATAGIEKIADEIRSRIDADRYPEGWMASADSLARDLHVNHTRVRAAFKLLVEEGTLSLPHDMGGSKYRIIKKRKQQ